MPDGLCHTMTQSIDDFPKHGAVHFTNLANVGEIHLSKITAPHDQGWSRQLIRKNINGSPDLLVTALRLEPHHHHARHFHDNVGEVYFVHQGRCRIEVGDRAEWVEAGGAVYVPRGIPHCIDTGDESAIVLVIFPEGDINKVGKEFVKDSEARF